MDGKRRVQAVRITALVLAALLWAPWPAAGAARATPHAAGDPAAPPISPGGAEAAQIHGKKRAQLATTGRPHRLFPGNLAGVSLLGAAGRAAIHTVCRTGPPDCEYATIQAAVDAASDGDLIQVAGGVYSDLHSRPAPPGYRGPITVSQVVYLSRTVTIRGGYTTSNGFADPPDPIAHPTVLDAQGQGRVLFIAGAINPTLEGLYLTGGDAAGQGGDFWANSAGGGVYVVTATATLSNNQVHGNVSGQQGGGGGLYLLRSASTLQHNVVWGNSALGDGGGVYMWGCRAVMSHNVITANTAITWGGGLFLSDSPLWMEDNTIHSNEGAFGGGISATGCDGATFIGNSILSNTAVAGGGFFLGYTGWTTPALVLSNTIASNTVSWTAGGVYALYSPSDFVGNQIVDNRGSYRAGGLYDFSGDALFVGNTFARNVTDGEGGAMVLDTVANPIVTGNLFLENTALAGGAISMQGSHAILEQNVFSGNAASGNGGALQCIYSPAVLVRNVITANTAITYGGGLHLYDSSATLLSNTISGNVAQWGGGAFLEESPATVRGNLFSGNSVVRAGGALNVHLSDATIDRNTIVGNSALYGGGMRLYQSEALLTDNHVSGNSSLSYGGGLHLWYSPATLVHNTISGNQAGGDGGGVELWYSGASLEGNAIFANQAGGNGGGIYLLGSSPTLDGNTVVDNRAGNGGGVAFSSSSDAVLLNTLIAGNQAAGSGSGLFVHSSSPYLRHTTIACNHGGDGSGVYLAVNSSAALTNTVLVSHTTGVYLGPGTTAFLEATLWGSGPWGNGQDWAGGGTIVTGTVNLWAEPAFLDPAVGDYHLSGGSAAIDAGVDAGVARDIDGQPRPLGAGADIGADEFPAALEVTILASPDPVAAGSALTYTLRVVNIGVIPLQATIVDLLPDHVTPTGVISWTAPLPYPGSAWQQAVVVTVEAGYTGPLTHVLQVSTVEGAVGRAIRVVQAREPIAGLVAANDGPTPLGQVTTFSATVTAGSDVSYSWAFGDGNTASGAQVTHVYADVGSYTAVVTASNGVSTVVAETQVVVSTAGAYQVHLPLVWKRGPE